MEGEGAEDAAVNDVVRVKHTPALDHPVNVPRVAPLCSCVCVVLSCEIRKKRGKKKPSRSF